MDELARIADRFWQGRWSLVAETNDGPGRARHRVAIAWRDGRIPLEASASTHEAAVARLLVALRRLDAELPVRAARHPTRARTLNRHRPAA